MKKIISPVIVIYLSVALFSCNRTNVIRDEPPDASITKQEASRVQEENPKPIEIIDYEVKPVYYRGRAVVLMYHHISTKHLSSITISPQRFEEDLKMLQSNKFNIITLRHLVNAMDGRDTLPPNSVVITFDDGIESFYNYAYPLLKKYKIPATNFIITSRTEAYRPSNNDFNPLSPAEIREMYLSGLVDIQSHSHNGHDYVYRNSELEKVGKLAFKGYNKKAKSFNPQETYERMVSQDLKASREIIKGYTGDEPDILAFPFGHYNSTLIKMGKRSGFRYFVTTAPGANRQNTKSVKILRIRAGEKRIPTLKLKRDIIYYGKSNLNGEKK